MARKREDRRARHMKPAILVVCEGETEEGYVDFLRHQYRCPIRIVSRILGDDISERKLNAVVNDMKISGSDLIHTFIMYDRDVAAVNDRIDKLSAEKLCSNPCIELWFLLHELSIKRSLTTNQCLAELKKRPAWANYRKSLLSIKQRECLWGKRKEAVDNAKSLRDFANPSSTIYKLMEMLEENV